MPATLHRGVSVSGRAFAELRLDLRLTQGELAERLGMSLGRISSVEQNDSSTLRMKNFRRLAKLVGTDPDRLERRIGAADGNVDPVCVVGEVAAGGLVESLVYDEALAERLPIAFPTSQRVYALRIRGDSMAPA